MKVDVDVDVGVKVNVDGSTTIGLVALFSFVTIYSPFARVYRKSFHNSYISHILYLSIISFNN